MLEVAPINHRWQIADLLKNVTDGIAVEVGTHRGVFAEQFIRVWTDNGSVTVRNILYCIDPWKIPKGYEKQALVLADSNGDRQADYLAARELLQSYITLKRVYLVQDESPRAAERFDTASLDFVYVDGDHREQCVLADLRAWWPKIKDGGILAGHDFITPGESWGRDVQAAVMAFAKEEGLTIYLVIENGPDTAGQPWTWYVKKS